MDVLVVGEKNYVKASVIARELGYTADYVGQLCRSGKVNAKLVGRSWYVERDSIHGHKKTRYRSTQTTSKKALLNSVRVQVEDPVSVSHFYTHHERTNGTPKSTYLEDESELIPKVNKQVSTRLSIGLADSKELKVASRADSYTIENPKLSKIKFSGTLRVTDVVDDADEEVSVPKNGTLIHAHEVQTLKSEKTLKNIVKSDKSTQVKVFVTADASPDTASAQMAFTGKITKAEVPLARMSVSNTDRDFVENAQEQKQNVDAHGWLQTLVVVIVALFCALVAVVLILALEVHGQYQIPNFLTWSYHFDFQNIYRLFELIK